MATAKTDTTPYWATSATLPQFGKVTGDAEADVVVVGGGITGLTTGYLLAKAGKHVAVEFMSTRKWRNSATTRVE